MKYYSIVISLLGKFCKVLAGLWLSVRIVSVRILKIYPRSMIPIKF